MIILGIETSTQQVGCALGGQEGVLGSFQTARGKNHAEVITPSIEFLCKQARIEISEISCIAVGLGPGLFTGLRVGIATAKAMAMALHVPMLGFSSLDLLASPVRWSNRLIVPVIDAKRGEIFWSFYRQVSGGVMRLGDYRVGKPDELAAELVARKEHALLVGDGAVRYSDYFEDVGDIERGTVGDAYPSAAALVSLAQPRALREEFVRPEELKPLYLRKSDAEVNWDLRESANSTWSEQAG